MKQLPMFDEGVEYCCCPHSEGVEPHTCPYAEEIHNDDTTLCKCCPACETECARDV